MPIHFAGRCFYCIGFRRSVNYTIERSELLFFGP